MRAIADVHANPVLIEPVQPGDEEAIAELWRVCGAAPYGVSRPRVCLVARESATGRVVGAAEYYRGFPPEDAYAWVGVHPNARRAGLGSSLLRELARIALGDGIRNMGLFVEADDQRLWHMLDRAGIPLRAHAIEDGHYVELDLVALMKAAADEADRRVAEPVIRR